jgi:GNAT superfamily N-acetyltransferase
MLSLKDLRPAEVGLVSQENMTELIRFWNGMTDAFDLIEDDGFTRLKSSFPYPLFNSILKTKLQESENISQIIRDYQNNHTPFAWHIWEHDHSKIGSILLENGAKPIESTALLAIDLESYHPLSEPLTELKIRAVRTKIHSVDFSKCLSAIFNFPKPLVMPLSNLIRKQDQNIESYVGYMDDTPVATGTVFYSNGAAGIYNVGTLPEFQGKGIGVEMMTTLLLKAKLDDMKTAILHSTPAGQRIYEKLGFQNFGKIKRLVFVN